MLQLFLELQIFLAHEFFETSVGSAFNPAGIHVSIFDVLFQIFVSQSVTRLTPLFSETRHSHAISLKTLPLCEILYAP